MPHIKKKNSGPHKILVLVCVCEVGGGFLLKIAEKSSRYLKINLMLTGLLTGLPVSHTYAF